MKDNLYLRNGIWYVDLYRSGKRVRTTTGTRDYDVAAGIAKGLRESAASADKCSWVAFTKCTQDELAAYLAKGRERALRRDRKRGREPALSPDDVRQMLARSKGCCELTGIPFSMDKHHGTFRRPFAPSIDRINNEEPYSLENCRLVALAVNIGVNEWGERVFRRIALGFLSRGGSTLAPTLAPEQEQEAA